MRRLFLLLLLPLFAPPSALAQTRESKAAPHVRVTWQERFAQANTTHDGQLTREQARAGFPAAARWFDAIDANNKGFVTTDDLAVWHKTQRVARRATGPGTLPPSPAPADNRTHALRPQIAAD